MTQEKSRVVVLGGGYAGVMAANRLTQHDDLEIVLVNRRATFVERIRLHQLVAGNDDAVADYSTVLSEKVQRLVDDVSLIDAKERRVALSSGQSLCYDYLIYAVGSTGTVPAGVPGAVEFAYPTSELEQAERLRQRLADVPTTAPIVVVGGGLTGIEAASEFAEAGRPVTLVTDVLAPSLGRGGRRSVAKQLAKSGVAVIEGRAVSRVTADGVMLGTGRWVPSAVTVWTAGFGVPGLAAASGLTTDKIGRLLTDDTLTSVDDAHIVAAGDAASPSGVPLRMSCQAALPLGAQAAQTVLARLAGEDPARLNQGMALQCISVGRHAGTIQFVHTDDTPRGFHVGGRTGAFVKEQVCRYTLKWLGGEATKPGSFKWPKGSDRQPQSADAQDVAIR